MTQPCAQDFVDCFEPQNLPKKNDFCSEPNRIVLVISSGRFAFWTTTHTTHRDIVSTDNPRFTFNASLGALRQCARTIYTSGAFSTQNFPASNPHNLLRPTTIMITMRNTKPACQLPTLTKVLLAYRHHATLNTAKMRCAITTISVERFEVVLQYHTRSPNIAGRPAMLKQQTATHVRVMHRKQT